MAQIMVVEDNAANRQLAALLLRHGGHQVILAADAMEGIRVAREKRPDLILMDIQLPGMDGLTATRLLKLDSETRDIRVVALTAFAMQGDEDAVRGAGCEGYIAKPIRAQQFLNTIATLLEKPQRTPTPESEPRQACVASGN